MSRSSGSTLHGRYEILTPLGVGGSAHVYRVRDHLRGLDVALKVVPLEGAEPPPSFVAEFTALRGLFHPSLARVHDFGRAVLAGEAVAFYTTDLVDGASVDRFAEGRSWPDARRPLADGLRALAFLHRAGLRHGDVKPDNLLVDRSGRGVLIDLGAAAAPPPGTVSGTPGFLAPELLAGAPPDPRADIYAAGVTIRHVAALAHGVPAAVVRLAERMTQADPSRRPVDVEEVLAALGEPTETEVAPVWTAPLLEREEALATGRRLIDALEHGTPGFRALLLCGPAGVGRSRALQECKWLAQPRARVVEADAGRADAIVDLLRRTAEEPSITDDVAGVVTAWRRLAAAEQPVVLVVDDLQNLAPPQRDLLDSFLRLLQPAAPVAVFGASFSPPAETPPTIRVLTLAPLSEAAVRIAAGSRIPSGRIPELLRATGGLPGELAAVLGRVRSGAEDFFELADAARLDDRRLSSLHALDDDARRILGLCAALDGRLEPNALTAFAVAPDALRSLVADRWLLADGPLFRLPRPGDAGRLVAALGSARMSPLHGVVADFLAGREVLAERTRQLALAGRLDEAVAAFADGKADRDAHPHAWRRPSDVLADVRPDPQVVLAASEVHEAAGDPRRALDLARPLLDRDLSLPMQAAVHVRVGACHLKLGDAPPTLRHLLRALELEPDPRARVRIVDLLCRAYIQQGAYEQAARTAEEHLAHDAHGPSAELHEDLGVALSYLGRDEAARGHLAAAERLAAGRDDPRARVRRLSYQGIIEYRVGDVRAAAGFYARALELAERHGLVDQAASAALNLGTARQRRGDWGPAFESYERGLELAAAVGKVRTEVALHFDLAQLHCDVGRFERAEQVLSRARELAERAGLELFVSLSGMLAGEILLCRGRADEAQRRLETAREALRAHGTPRELADVELHLAEVALARRLPDEAAARTAAAEAAAETAGADDLCTRALLCRGRLELQRGDGARAMVTLEEARPAAERSDQRDLEGEIESWLAVACESQGAIHAAERHRSRALELWDRCAATLPAHARDGVWSHPRRAHLPRPAAPAGAAASGPTPRERKLERLLEINARLNSSLDARHVLEFTMDAAVELTGAERGFLLLAPTPGEPEAKLRVAVARNVDREALGRAGMKFSRGIAERVLATGEPVLTAEAQTDDRFAAQRSVQAMGLVAVLSVPIRGREGILGALYVDNRFQRGRFTAADLDVLLALADQVGIALANARLLAELDRRTRQLEQERKRITASLEDRRREVDRLTEQVRTTKRALQRRYDYGEIVGRGAAMQAVFDTLDRVTASTLSVLIEGESGTGKELVARALHANGPRRSEEFVGVNCGALTETLLESELFGHVRGAFTGADRDRVGLFAQASGGTLFLDEVGEMPPSMQVKLLRALEQGEIRPVGSSSTVPVSPRVVCATNRRLAREVEEGRFREDLYYRLAVVQVVVPPLRERVEDIPDLARHLLQRLAAESGRKAPELSLDALRRLLAYDWPGNVRQLENVLSQALVFAAGDSIESAEILLPAPARGPRRDAHREFQAREATEIASALDSSRWNVTQVCRSLGIARTTLYRRMKRYGLSRRK